MHSMKKGYLELCLLTVFVYMCCIEQGTFASRQHARGRCRRCPAGFGVAVECAGRRDTECEACAPGRFSAGRSLRPCLPCSRCGPGLYEAHACTPASDTVCDSCHTVRGPRNQDFYLRCVAPMLAPHAVTDSVVAVEVPREVPPPALMTSVAAAAGGALSVLLFGACVLFLRRRHCQREANSYSYQAVSTKEAIVMI